MRDLKVAVIGAGSTYTPELMEGFIKRVGRLNLREIALMDIDEYRLGVLGGMIQRMIEKAGLSCRCVQTTDLERAVDGADYVLAQVRVGRLAARIKDEKIPLKYGLIGQETTGIGGFFKGLRTIPVILNVARTMERLCPDAWLINFSNPSGLVAEAVQNESSIKMLGLCNNAINMYRHIRQWAGSDTAELEYFGLNHLTWLTKVIVDGRDLLQDALSTGMSGAKMKNIPDSGFDPECLRAAGGIPCGYLNYYYRREAMLDKLKNEPRCRGEVCEEIEQQLYEIYKNPNITTKPDLLNQRGGALYSEAAVSLVESIENGSGETHVVNIRNQGALDFMQYNDVIEIPAVVRRDSVTPIPVKTDNQHIIALMQVVKAYERHAARAALTGDRLEAMRAMMIHPLIGDFKAARDCFDEMLQAHKEHLPQFFR
jgi:6-phospho-beta-glucosidase